MFSLVGFLWDFRDRGPHEIARWLADQLQAAPVSWTEAFSAPGMRIFCKGVRPGSIEPHRLYDDAGVILGSVFERHSDPFDPSPCPPARFDEHQTRALIETQGRRLLTAYWGRYVAFLRDRDGRKQWILHDPTSALPCYQTRRGPVSIFFSHLPDLNCLHLPDWEIDKDALRVRAAVGMQDAGNLLENVERLYGGECAELNGGGVSRRQFYWNPLTIAESDVIDDAEIATRALHAAVKSAVHTWASCHESIVVRASGGLDSSIVAGCLRDAPCKLRLNCFTTFMPQNPHNTLPWSRLMAEHLNVKPREYARHPHVDWSALLRAPPATHPEYDLGSLEFSVAEQEFVRECGATAIFTGDGGDSLFGATAAQFAAREFLRRRGLRWEIRKVAEDVALLRDLTVWSVLGDALRARRRGEPNELVNQSRKRTLVNREVLEAYQRTDTVPHPWYGAPSSNRPWSTILRIGTLAQTTPLYDPRSDPARGSPEYVLPLYSQPAVEVCLRTPLYLTIARGRERVLARKAFMREVPAKILNRYWKDHPTGLLEGMMTINLPWVRELLLDGVLARLGVIDKQMIDKHLRPESVKSPTFGGELFNLVADETWARNFAPA
jgi:asparagine synthase (glutamine-hydrolysing)